MLADLSVMTTSRVAETPQVDYPITRLLEGEMMAPKSRGEPGPGSSGPSWLTLFDHSKDRLWNVDLF